MAAIGVLLAAGSIMLSVILFVQGQNLRRDAQLATLRAQEQRTQDEARVDRLICERQQVVTGRLIDQKQNSMSVARTMRGLIVRVARTTDTRLRRRQLVQAARSLSEVVRRFKRGRRILQAELAAVDCARLPRGQRFRRSP